MVVDGGHDGGQRRAGLGRCSSLLCPRFGLGRRGGEPPVGLSAPAAPLDHLHRAIGGEQQPTNRTITTMSSTGTGIFRLVVQRIVSAASKAVTHSIFQTSRMRVSRADAGRWLLRFRSGARVRRGERESGAARLNGPGGPINAHAARPMSQLGPSTAAPAASHLSAQLAVGGDHEAAAGQLPHQGHDRVIAGAVGLDHPHPAPAPPSRSRRLLIRAAAARVAPSRTMTNSAARCHRAGRGGPGRASGGEFGVQPDRRAGPVPPPAVGTRSHDVGDIHDDRGRMLADPVLLRTVS